MSVGNVNTVNNANDSGTGNASETQPNVAPENAPSASTSGWTKTVFDTDMIGTWEGPEHKPLPEVKIARPHPDRKFKATPPDFNIKFRIPTGSGVYEGGCDTYISGKAFCRVHDPADPKALRLMGKKIEGIIVAEYTYKPGSGDMLRMTIPNGVVTNLVRRPDGTQRKTEPTK
jgi:hypothetical protein